MKKYKGMSVFKKGEAKVCISLMGENREEILTNLSYIMMHHVDVIEWRADYYSDLLETEKVIEIIKLIKNKIDDIPLLFTIRTSNEGGNVEISKDEYKEILISICECSKTDMIDLEYMMGESVITEVILSAHNHSIGVIGSNHDFDKTPSSEVLYDRLLEMYNLGMDVSKIAVMPKSRLDVANILYTTEKMNEEHPEILTITMAMGSIGKISRVIGYMFGSVMTFGAGLSTSAPGQIEADHLYAIMNELKEI